MDNIIIGIDISKLTFDVALLKNEQLTTKKFTNSNNFKVSVVNPARIKGFAQSKLCRVKTDKADCKLIAQFCSMMSPTLWKPAAQHIKQLKEWVNRLDALIANRLQESNRIEGSN